MADFWVVGPIAWDWVLRVPHLPPSGGFVQAEAVAGRPGGAGANTAIALASTGAAVHMIGYTGDDEPGARLRAALKAAGVDAAFVHRRSGHTSQVAILVEPSGERAIIGVHPDLLHSVPVPAAQVTSGDVVYFAAWHDEFLPAMQELIGRGVTVATVPPPRLEPGLPATYVLGSQTQFGGRDPGGGVCARAPVLRAVIVTKGADGAVVHQRDRSLAHPAHDVPVVDTTGAGDAFAAGFLHQIGAGGTLADAAADGMSWASAAVQAADSIPPPWEVVRGRVGAPPSA